MEYIDTVEEILNNKSITKDSNPNLYYLLLGYKDSYDSLMCRFDGGRVNGSLYAAKMDELDYEFGEELKPLRINKLTQ